MSALCFGLRCETHANERTNAVPALGKKWDNVSTEAGELGLYIPEFSKPTGKYASKLLVKLLNVLLRKGSLVFIGNPCTPGMTILDEGFGNIGNDILQQTKHSSLVANFYGNSNPSGAVVFPAEPYMHIDIAPAWKTATDYQDAMHSKYRVRIKKTYACSNHLTSKTVPGTLLREEQKALISQLLTATLANKTLALPSDLLGLIDGFCHVYGNQYQTTFYQDTEGNTIGFLSSVRKGNECFAMHIGYKPENAKAWHLYQRMMLDLIAREIEQDTQRIHLGRTATEIKSTLGATPVSNSMVIYSKKSVILWILKVYKKWFFKEKEYIIRQPFRQAGSTL